MQGPIEVAEDTQVSTFDSTTLSYVLAKYATHQIVPLSMAEGVTATVSGKARGATGYVDIDDGAGIVNNKPYIVSSGVWDGFKVTYSDGGTASSKITSYNPPLREGY